MRVCANVDPSETPQGGSHVRPGRPRNEPLRRFRGPQGGSHVPPADPYDVFAAPREGATFAHEKLKNYFKKLLFKKEIKVDAQGESKIKN